MHLRIARARREIVERFRRRVNHVRTDERRAFARAILGVLQAALPLEHGPAVVTVLRELRKDAFEIDLTVTERTETAGPVDPALIAAVNAGATVRAELGVLDVKRLDALVVEIDE